MPETYLITGAAGFLGSSLVRALLDQCDDVQVVGVDNMSDGSDIARIQDYLVDDSLAFEEVDAVDAKALDRVFAAYEPNVVINLLSQDMEATRALLEVCRGDWEEPDGSFGANRFIHISSTAVYGGSVLASSSPVGETAPFEPMTYGAVDVAATELSVKAFASAHGLPANILRCSDCFGPYQSAGRRVPAMILSVLDGKEMPQADNSDVLDWLFIDDFVAAVMAVARSGIAGETFNISGHNNLGQHTLYTGVSSKKAKILLDWEPKVPFGEGLDRTIAWYLANPSWR